MYLGLGLVGIVARKLERVIEWDLRQVGGGYGIERGILEGRLEWKWQCNE